MMKSFWLIVLVVFLGVSLTKGEYVNNTEFDERTSRDEKWSFVEDDANEDPTEGIWSRLLEDFTLSKSNRSPKFVPPPKQFMPPPAPSPQNQFIASPQDYFITKRMGEAMELEPHMRPPAKVISQNSSPNFPIRQAFVQNQPLREVSETDLYLLGAIEKLVYRVDYLESRVRRSEQLIYYLMAGNKQKEVQDPCPVNFSRIGDNCYHLQGDRQANWKTANGICKSLGAHLAEFESISENEDIVAYLLNHPSHRGKDFWLGGLNPGLLWIWSNSAKPVNPNTNLTVVASSASPSSTTEDSKIEKDKDDKGASKIVNNSNEIKGAGRCLRLSYNPAKHTYFYYGQECTSRHFYLCEYQDKTLDNKIKKIARDLKLDWV